MKSGYFSRCFSPRIGKFVVTSIANISFLLKKTWGKKLFVIARALHFTVSITPTKVKSLSRRASFQNFCAITSILKLLIIAKKRASERITVNLKVSCEDRRRKLCSDVRVSRYQSICDFYRYFTDSYRFITLTMPAWMGCFIHFIFYPHIGLWPS